MCVCTAASSSRLGPGSRSPRTCASSAVNSTAACCRGTSFCHQRTPPPGRARNRAVADRALSTCSRSRCLTVLERMPPISALRAISRGCWGASMAAIPVPYTTVACDAPGRSTTITRAAAGVGRGGGTRAGIDGSCFQPLKSASTRSRTAAGSTSPATTSTASVGSIDSCQARTTSSRVTLPSAAEVVSFEARVGVGRRRRPPRTGWPAQILSGSSACSS